MKNIILIGMPGCGKSTVGIVLAKLMGFGFIDTDLIIQAEEKLLLSEIIEQKGIDAFNEIENRINSSIEASRCIIATGGSVVYGREAMEHFKKIGVVIYMKLPHEALAERLGSLSKRGVLIREGQTLLDLYNERIPLYEKYADIIIAEDGMSIQDTALYIKEKCDEYDNKQG